jgi:phosphoribosylaminoimidazolecarboxamide formyltransferase / IMP cyclohydrolase
MLTVLASVYEKNGLVDLLKRLAAKDELKVIATGSTCQYLKDNGFNCVKVEDMTGFPEILGGRVKTLHPRVFAGILARGTEEDRKTLATHEISEIDVVIVNLYPFEAKQALNLKLAELIEFIDIGGVSLIRAAAKNFARVSILGNESQYEEFASVFEAGKLDEAYRRKLAAEAFDQTRNYDSVIAKALHDASQGEKIADFPKNVSLNLDQLTPLRYGENPHQAAAWYGPLQNAGDITFPPFEQLAGKELSANNIVDCYALVRILRDVSQSSSGFTACIIKHNNPCGVAIGKTCEEAFDRAYNTDPLSAFGGVYGFSGTVSEALAKKIVQGFVEIVAALDFEPAAIEVLTTKKNMRVLKLKPTLLAIEARPVRIKDMGDFGFIVEKDVEAPVTVEKFEVVCGDPKLLESLHDDIGFAWNVVRHLTSNAIAVVKDGNGVGFGIGQTSRVASVKLALAQAGEKARGGILASDAFFPAVDSIEEAAAAGIGIIVQPGGSIKDKDVIEKAKALGITMLLTGQRCFRH